MAKAGAYIQYILYVDRRGSPSLGFRVLLEIYRPRQPIRIEFPGSAQMGEDVDANREIGDEICRPGLPRVVDRKIHFLIPMKRLFFFSPQGMMDVYLKRTL